MNNVINKTMSPDALKTVRQLNDNFRQTFTGGTVMLTASIAMLGDARQAEIMAAVRNFTDFKEENDPHLEHDFGAFDVAGERIMFKIDYFDLSKTWYSPDPADPCVTARVLTIMLASDW